MAAAENIEKGTPGSDQELDQSARTGGLNFDIQLNVNNVFDRRYYEVVDSFSGGNFVGEPRNVLLTGKITF